MLNIELWEQLSKNSLDEIKNVCDQHDADKLVKMMGIDDEHLNMILQKSIACARQIVNITSTSSCNCINDEHFDNIYNFIKIIKENGGADQYFCAVLKNNKARDLPTLATCAATCYITCLPVSYYPPAMLLVCLLVQLCVMKLRLINFLILLIDLK